MKEAGRQRWWEWSSVHEYVLKKRRIALKTRFASEMPSRLGWMQHCAIHLADKASLWQHSQVGKYKKFCRINHAGRKQRCTHSYENDLYFNTDPMIERTAGLRTNTWVHTVAVQCRFLLAHTDEFLPNQRTRRNFTPYRCHILDFDWSEGANSFSICTVAPGLAVLIRYHF